MLRGAEVEIYWPKDEDHVRLVLVHNNADDRSPLDGRIPALCIPLQDRVFVLHMDKDIQVADDGVGAEGSEMEAIVLRHLGDICGMVQLLVPQI